MNTGTLLLTLAAYIESLIGDIEEAEARSGGDHIATVDDATLTAILDYVRMAQVQYKIEIATATQTGTHVVDLAQVKDDDALPIPQG